MSIANFKVRKPAGEFRKTEFINLSQGKHIIRFLQPEAVIFDTHYLKRVTLKCLGTDCPICANNKRMFIEHGKEARNMQGFVGQRQVGYINVLDKTPVKICPNCGAEVKKVGNNFPPTCSNTECNASLVAVKPAPLNKVKVLSKGKMVFDQLEYHNASVLDEETQTPIGFMNYDFEVLVVGGKDTKVAPTLNPLPETAGSEVVYDEKDLFDLDKALLELDVHEILELQRGVSLKDIFASRKAQSEDAPVNSELREAMDSLFEN